MDSGMEVLDRAAWQRELVADYTAAWEAFREALVSHLARDALPPLHAARARRLLALGGVHFQPLLPSNADAVGDFIADRFITGNPFTVESGIGLVDLRTLFRTRLRARAARGDPLSVTAWVGGRVHAVYIFWDPIEDDTPSDVAANLACEGARRMYEAKLRADALLDQAIEADPALPAEVRPSAADRTILHHQGATSDFLHIFLTDDERSLPPGVRPSIMKSITTVAYMRAHACSVYTLVKFYAHARSMPVTTGGDLPDAAAAAAATVTADESGGDVAAEGTRYLGWIAVPYAELGLRGVTGQSMLTGRLRMALRPQCTWSSTWEPTSKL